MSMFCFNSFQRCGGGVWFDQTEQSKSTIENVQLVQLGGRLARLLKMMMTTMVLMMMLLMVVLLMMALSMMELLMMVLLMMMLLMAMLLTLMMMI